MKHVQTLWIVIRQELLLVIRGKVIWFVVGIVALLGIIEALRARSTPLGIWDTVILDTVLVSLLITLTTGEQAYIEHEAQVERILWSTPVNTWVYLAGKYVSNLLIAMGLILVHLLAAILIDQWYPSAPGLPKILAAPYPSAGHDAYVIWTVWYLLVPTLFGSALALTITALTRGQRIISHVVSVILWTWAYAGGLPIWFDLIGNSFFNHDIKLPGLDAAVALIANLPRDAVPTAEQKRYVIDHVRLDLPPTFLPWTFAQSRLFLVGIAIILLILTAMVVQYRRTNTAKHKG